MHTTGSYLQIKTKCKMSMLFLDPNFTFFPMVLTVFAVPSQISCTYRKMDKTIYRNCPSIQHAASAYMTQLTGKPSAPFERAYNFLVQ